MLWEEVIVWRVCRSELSSPGTGERFLCESELSSTGTGERFLCGSEPSSTGTGWWQSFIVTGWTLCDSRELSQWQDGTVFQDISFSERVEVSTTICLKSCVYLLAFENIYKICLVYVIAQESEVLTIKSKQKSAKQINRRQWIIFFWIG